METPSSSEKLGQGQDVRYAASSNEGGQFEKNSWGYLKHYFTSREGWIGDYVLYPSVPLKIVPQILTKWNRTMSTSLRPIFGH